MGFAPTDDGQEIYYEVHEGNGPTLVLVSGYMGISDIWQPLLARFSSRYRCIIFDNRGFGRSSKPDSEEAYSIHRHAADLDAVLKALNIDHKVVLVTHSMGGNIASAYYLAHPDKVSGIISSGTYFDGKLADGRFLTFDALTHRVDEPSKAAEFYSNMGLDKTIALEAAKWPAYARRHNAKAVLTFDMGDKYSSITVPILLIQGDLDVATPVEGLVRPIEKSMPSCRLEVLKGVNHFPPTEAPEQMEMLIDEFVKTFN